VETELEKGTMAGIAKQRPATAKRALLNKGKKGFILNIVSPPVNTRYLIRWRFEHANKILRTYFHSNRYHTILSKLYKKTFTNSTIPDDFNPVKPFPAGQPACNIKTTPPNASPKVYPRIRI